MAADNDPNEGSDPASAQNAIVYDAHGATRARQ